MHKDKRRGRQGVVRSWHWFVNDSLCFEFHDKYNLISTLSAPSFSLHGPAKCPCVGSCVKPGDESVHLDEHGYMQSCISTLPRCGEPHKCLLCRFLSGIKPKALERDDSILLQYVLHWTSGTGLGRLYHQLKNDGYLGTSDCTKKTPASSKCSLFSKKTCIP